MAESTPVETDLEAKSSSLFELAKEGMGAILHDGAFNQLHLHLQKESHNVLDRAKEEIDALLQKIHPTEEHRDQLEDVKSKLAALVSSPDAEHGVEDLGKAKEELEAILQKQQEQHKETGDEVDENRSMSDVQAPSFLERAKEEMEALVQTTLSDKEGSTSISLPDSEGLMVKIGSWFEKICAPLRSKRD